MPVYLVGPAVQLVGLVVVIIGGLRIIRARAMAARRSALVTNRPGDESAGRYARGLTDFYRISGAVAVVAGIVLLLVPLFAR